MGLELGKIKIKRFADGEIYVAVEVNLSNLGPDQVLTFRTNVGDVVEAGPDNPIRFVDEDETGGMKPYLLVRGRLEALVSRAVRGARTCLRPAFLGAGRPFAEIRSAASVVVLFCRIRMPGGYDRPDMSPT